jgi:hypothetical protein
MQAIKDRLLGLKTGLFLRFQEKGFPLRFLEGEGFLAWIRYLREGERREERYIKGRRNLISKA